MERGGFWIGFCCMLFIYIVKKPPTRNTTETSHPSPETLPKTHPETNDIIRFSKFHKMETIILVKIPILSSQERFKIGKIYRSLQHDF